MKDGRTRLGENAEHVFDLGSEYVLGVDVRSGTESDSLTLNGSLLLARMNLVRLGSEAEF